MNRRKGKFIVFEGIDGSGKSTQVRCLLSHLEKRGIDVCETREPQNDRPVGALLRSALGGKTELNEGSIALLFASDRLDHISSMLPMLEEGTSIVCDRYYFSSFAYNDTALDSEWIISVNAEAMRLLRPDLVIFLDVPSDVSIERLSKRAGVKEIFETPKRQERVRRNYLDLFERFRNEENVVIIDGTLDASDVTEKVIEAVDKLF